MIHQAHGPGPASAVLCLDDIASVDRTPRVYDFTLARALGYEHARNIRRLIKTARAELETHGDLVEVEDRTGGAGNLLSAGANTLTPRAGRPGRAFYLNEPQALVICALTRTPIAAKVRSELIKVFMLHRVGRLRRFPATVTSALVPAERKALSAIVRRADVVMAPPCTVSTREDAFHNMVDIPVGYAGDGHVPYLLAPITEEVLATLAEFEADLADLEGDVSEEAGDQCDDEGSCDVAEPSLGSLHDRVNQTSWGWGGMDDDREAEHDGREPEEDADESDREPSLGSLSANVSQVAWSGTLTLGAADDRELDDCDDEDVEDYEDELDDDGDRSDTNGSDDDPVFPPLYNSRAILAMEAKAMRRASARLRGTIERLRGHDGREVRP